ncbi:MAG: type I-E CRISPR-associated protein Cas6/Cse3/CasE [candidate division KSB1 bacterium]|nr:type I-E CRISPR-associated protein Cas6/Cse3/CasE [candidate division KSB1 bacterium]
MYLSRLILNPTNRRVQRELANLYELHRSLMRAFPDDLKEGQERILFRVDVDERTGIPTVLVQSHTQPDWTWLGDPRTNSYLLRVPESKPFELAFAAGQILAFRLRANPTRKHWREVEGEQKPKRDPLYREEEQIAWLERKGAAGGFRLVRVTVIEEGNLYGQQPLEQTGGEKGPKAHRLTFHAVRFEGVLQVTDPARLWETVRRGVGPGKGLGFGLLSLAPLPT